ncbi:extracellular solute-binding protein [Oceanibium sediminis]|uniref:extracellular solute-binding protein n=1 Tax=Oceanibium sediminis TaxID=2026339 RepID=UPI000DD3D8E7|nr:extracellular solute-binding protein [Oceanibium sediminis]
MKSTLYAAGLAAAAFAASAAHSAEIEFWYGNTGAVEEAIQAQCAAFNAAQSEHVVSCVGQGGYEPAMQKAIAAYRSSQHPVLIQFFDAGTLDLMLSGAVRSVQDLMSDVDWDDYVVGARSFYETSTGELFSQPYNGSTLIFYANMDMLGDVGVSEIPQTYEDVVTVARKLKDNGHECPVLQRVHPWFSLEQFSARHGEAIASNNNGYGGLDAEFTFNTGLVATHLQNIQSWRDEGLFRLPTDVAGGKNAFVTGECAMVENSTAHYAAAFPAHGDAIAIGLPPIYDGYQRHNTLIGGGSIWAMQGHDDADYDAARAFLNFVRQNDQQIEFAGRTGYMPVTNSALAALLASDKSDQLEYATAAVGVGSLNQPGDENSRGIRLGFYVQFRDVYTEEVTKALNGEQDMQVALDNAAKRGDELLRRFEKTYQGVSLP